jgi:hypothetical protein
MLLHTLASHVILFVQTMAKEITELIHDMRFQLAKRGTLTIDKLGLAFAVNDRDRSGFFDYEEFEGILGRAGMFIKRQVRWQPRTPVRLTLLLTLAVQDLTKIFKFFDRVNRACLSVHDTLRFCCFQNGDGKISYQEFLVGLQGDLNERRLAMVQKGGTTALSFQQLHLSDFVSSLHTQRSKSSTRAATALSIWRTLRLFMTRASTRWCAGVSAWSLPTLLKPVLRLALTGHERPEDERAGLHRIHQLVQGGRSASPSFDTERAALTNCA